MPFYLFREEKLQISKTYTQKEIRAFMPELIGIINGFETG